MQNFTPITLAFCGRTGLGAKANQLGGEEWHTWEGTDSLLDAGMAHISLPSCPQLQA